MIMAYFAYVIDGIVQRVEPISNEIITTDKGNESEIRGKRFMVSLYPGTNEADWIQCSYNGKIRGCYPGRGYAWDGTNFISPDLGEISGTE
jgi:hypothetical protein